MKTCEYCGEIAKPELDDRCPHCGKPMSKPKTTNTGEQSPQRGARSLPEWRVKHGRIWAELTPGEVLALARWKRHEGRYWKSALLKAWGNHCYGGKSADAAILHGLRNRLGPVWLAKMVWPPVSEGSSNG